MSESILLNIKKLIGFDAEYEAFDVDLIIHINSIFATLNQLGVGPKETYSIADVSNLWPEFTDNKAMLNDVKTYMYFRLRLMFDMPTTSFAIASIKEQITELEWRLNVKADHSYT